MIMREAMFKVLVYSGQYVDINLLEKGIYPTSCPYLYSKGTTIEGLSELASVMKDITGELFVTGKYFENLNLCELVEVSLIGEI